MVTPAAGSVVLVPFPFPDLSQAKLRPAAVLSDVGRGERRYLEGGLQATYYNSAQG
jgi:hypothetical protein